MLLPGGRDISQPRLAHQLSLCSASLYEESLLQHRDHVSKRNKFVIPVHRLGCAHSLYVRSWIWTCATHTGNRSQSSVDSDLCQCQTPGKICSHRRSEKKNIPRSYLSKGDAAQKTLGTANKLILHVLFPKDVNWWDQLKAKLILKLAI